MTPSETLKKGMEEFDEKFLEKIKYVNYCLTEGEEMLDIQDIKSHLTTTSLSLIESIEKMVEEKGHQQEDDTIWCDMDDLLTSLQSEKYKIKKL